MRSIPATQAYIMGNDLALIKQVWEFFLDADQGGSVPQVLVHDEVGYVFLSQFGHCPMDSGVSVYFWTEGNEFCCLISEDPSYSWDLTAAENISQYRGPRFATVEEVALYITTGEAS